MCEIQCAPRRALFVAEFCVDRNGAAAARRAGYAPRAARQTASLLLTNADIRAAIRRRSEAVAKKLHVDHERMVAGLIDAFEAARIRRDPMAMIAAMREIGKLCGFYPEKGPRRGRWQPAANLKAMSNEELLAVLDDDGGHQGCSSAAA